MLHSSVLVMNFVLKNHWIKTVDISKGRVRGKNPKYPLLQKGAQVTDSHPESSFLLACLTLPSSLLRRPASIGGMENTVGHTQIMN